MILKTIWKTPLAEIGPDVEQSSFVKFYNNSVSLALVKLKFMTTSKDADFHLKRVDQVITQPVANE